MGTRCTITITDGNDTVPIYMHWSGDPIGVQAWIANSLCYGWPLPRFEPDDFAAALITGDRASRTENPGGNTRIIPRPLTADTYGSDLEFQYLICPNPDYKPTATRTAAADALLITGWAVRHNDTFTFDLDRGEYTPWVRTRLFTLPLRKFLGTSAKDLKKIQAGPART